MQNIVLCSPSDFIAGDFFAYQFQQFDYCNLEFVHHFDEAKAFLTNKENLIFFMVFRDSVDMEIVKYFRKPIEAVFKIVYLMVPTLLMIKEADKKIKPQGLWHRDDINSENLELTFKANLEHYPFYSPSIKKMLNQHTKLTLTDLQMLRLLERGIHTKDLDQFLPESQPTISRRKNRLKKLFQIEDLTDCALVRKAREDGLI